MQISQWLKSSLISRGHTHSCSFYCRKIIQSSRPSIKSIKKLCHRGKDPRWPHASPFTLHTHTQLCKCYKFKLNLLEAGRYLKAVVGCYTDVSVKWKQKRGKKKTLPPIELCPLNICCLTHFQVYSLKSSLHHRPAWSSCDSSLRVII